MQIQSVSSFYFLYQLLWNRDIHATIKAISEVYKAKSFKIALPFLAKNLFVLQDAHSVKQVLSAETYLGAVNENFNISHGHTLSINGLNMDDPVWKTLHTKLAHLFNHEKIDRMMEGNWDLLFPSEEFCINDTLKLFLSKVLADYFFGTYLSPEEYQKVQTDITDYVKISFHGSTVNRLPFIGKAMSYLNYYRYRDKIEAIDKKLNVIFNQSMQEETGVFYQLHQELSLEHPEADVKKMVLDNIFLSFLVFDFVYMVALDFFVNIAQSDRDRKEVAKQSVDRGFLFPFRFRVAKEQIEEINPDDFCILNLKAADLHFSYGPRRCVGLGLFNTFMAAIEKRIEGDVVTQVSAEPIRYADNPDIPAILSRHRLKVIAK